MSENAKAMIAVLQPFGQYTIKTVVNKKGTHSEATWRDAFPHFYRWLMQKPRKQTAATDTV